MTNNEFLNMKYVPFEYEVIGSFPTGEIVGVKDNGFGKFNYSISNDYGRHWKSVAGEYSNIVFCGTVFLLCDFDISTKRVTYYTISRNGYMQKIKDGYLSSSLPRIHNKVYCYNEELNLLYFYGTEEAYGSPTDIGLYCFDVYAHEITLLRSNNLVLSNWGWDPTILTERMISLGKYGVIANVLKSGTATNLSVLVRGKSILTTYSESIPYTDNLLKNFVVTETINAFFVAILINLSSKNGSSYNYNCYCRLTIYDKHSYSSHSFDLTEKRTYTTSSYYKGELNILKLYLLKNDITNMIYAYNGVINPACVDLKPLENLSYNDIVESFYHTEERGKIVDDGWGKSHHETYYVKVLNDFPVIGYADKVIATMPDGYFLIKYDATRYFFTKNIQSSSTFYSKDNIDPVLISYNETHPSLTKTRLQNGNILVHRLVYVGSYSRDYESELVAVEEYQDSGIRIYDGERVLKLKKYVSLSNDNQDHIRAIDKSGKLCELVDSEEKECSGFQLAFINSKGQKRYVRLFYD